MKNFGFHSSNLIALIMLLIATSSGFPLSAQIQIKLEIPPLPAGTIIPSNPDVDPVILPGGTVGSAYSSFNFGANDVTGELSWGSSGIPPGLNLHSVTGLFSGTPTAGCVYIFTVTATDEADSDDQKFQITINPVPAVNLGIDRSFCEGSSITLDAGGGWNSYLWSDNSTGQTLEVNSTGTYSVTVADANGCKAEDEVDITVVPQPSSPTLNTKTPNLVNVCEGTMVSATINPGSGGVGCKDTYEYSYNGTDWITYTSGAAISTSGQYSVNIRVRRDGCTAGAGCTGTGNTTIASWTVVSQPSAPTLQTKSPDLNSICAGMDVSATINPGSGGVGCSDQYEYSYDGTNWSAYTSGAAITTSGKTSVNIRGRRDGCTAGTGCTGTGNNAIALWTVVPQPSSPTLNTKTPNLVNVCEGTMVSATINAGSGGVGCSDTYEYSYNGTDWSTYTSGAAIHTSGQSAVNIRVKRDGCSTGAGCTGTAYTTIASWTVVSQPSAPTLQTKSPNLNNVCAGTNVSATINAGSGGIGCSDTYEYSYDGTNWSIYTSGGPIGTSGKSAVNIRVRRDGCTAGTGCAGTGNSTIASWTVKDCPIDVMLVLDVSGSMGESAGAGYAESKLEKLQEAVAIFLDPLFIQQYLMNCDRVGVVYFESSVTPDNPGLIEIGDETGITNLRSEISEKETGYRTAMGGGLYKAIRTLQDNTSNNSQNIILVSDGMQNLNPMIVEESGELTFKNEPIGYDPPWGNSNITLEGDPVIINTGLNIRVYTIGINATGEYADLLNKLADRTGATSNHDPQDYGYFFHQFLTESFLDISRVCSPQLIDYRYNTLSNTNQIEVFTVDKYSDHVLFILTGDKADNASFRFSMEKDSEDLTDIGQISDGPHYRIFAINLPVQVGEKTIYAPGDWKMKISGDPGVSYQASAIVDNPALNYECLLDIKERLVGKPLEIKAVLNTDGNPVSNATVKATIFKPSEKTGKLISKTSVITHKRKLRLKLEDEIKYIKEKSKTDTLLIDMPTFADKKYNILIGNPEIHQVIIPDKVNITLVNNGDGTYSYLFTDTRKPGIYRVEYEIEGDRDDLGHYVRTESRSVQINYDQSKRFRSRVFIFKANPAKDLPVRLYIRPKDKYGNFLGPGFSKQIEVILSNGRAGRVSDNLDGSYLIPLYDLDEKVDTDLKVIVMNKQVYDGTYFKLMNKFVINFVKCFITNKYGYTIDPGSN